MWRVANFPAASREGYTPAERLITSVGRSPTRYPILGLTRRVAASRPVAHPLPNHRSFFQPNDIRQLAPVLQYSELGETRKVDVRAAAQISRRDQTYITELIRFSLHPSYLVTPDPHGKFSNTPTHVEIDIDACRGGG